MWLSMHLIPQFLTLSCSTGSLWLRQAKCSLSCVSRTQLHTWPAFLGASAQETCIQLQGKENRGVLPSFWSHRPAFADGEPQPRPPLPHTGGHLFTLQTVLQRTTVLEAYGKPSQFSLKIINSRLVPQATWKAPASDEQELGSQGLRSCQGMR